MFARISVSLVLFSFLCLCQNEEVVYSETTGGKKVEIVVTSTAFTEGGMIPKEHTCDGGDVSPPLAWTGIPKGTKTLALICDDADAPRGTWVHWVAFNIPSSVKELPAKVPSEKTFDGGAKHGVNDFLKLGYGGPCPPAGTHRYYFRLFALDRELALDSGIAKGQLLKAMEGHILAEGQLMGRYKR